jgi:streptogramin lyase/anti-sigma regulatory factor (Ser/Thr protein kinase)
MKNKLPILSFIFLSFFCQAQSPYYWKLTDDDGLPSLEIYDLYQDSKGYMWIATDGGLCKFDGNKIVPYKSELQKRTATTNINESPDGTIWYKNFADQLFFIDSTNQAQLFSLPRTIKLNSYFKYSTKLAGKLRLASGNFLYDYTFSTQKWELDTILNCYKHGTITGFLSYNFEEEIYIDCFYNLLIKQKQLKVYKGTIPQKDFKLRSAIALGRDSVLLLGNNKVYIDHIDRVAQLDPQALFLVHGGIQGAYSVGKNQVWITSTKGIILLEKNVNTSRWEVKRKLLEQESIGSFCQDKEGNLWIGTLGNGIYIIPSLNMSYYNSQNSPLSNSKINCLELTTDHQLLIGSDKGTLTLLNPYHEDFSPFPSLGEHSVRGLFYDKKRNQALVNAKSNYIINLTKKSIEPSAAPINSHNIIYKEDQLITGGLLVLLTFSLKNAPATTLPPSKIFNNQFSYYTRYKENSPNSIKTVHATIQAKRTTALWADQIDSNCFWAGVDDSLFLYRNAIPFPILTPNGAAISPSDIHQDEDGIIWVSTANNGIYGIQEEKVIYHFTIRDGLPSNNCKRLTIYKNEIWIGTDKGIAKLNLRSKEINVYNQLDGLLTNNIDDIEIANQKVWAATSKGLISFDINTPSINKTPPLISITKWEVNDRSYAFNTPISLVHDQNNLKFTFQALSLKSRNTFTYEYRLLGIDSAWISQTSSTNFVRFPNLNAGNYTFQVRAKNEDGILSKATSQVSFSIQAPYWETWWFSSLLGLVFFIFIISILWLRYQFLQKKQATQNLITQLKMQALQAQMNPHFIFNAMSTIQSFWMYKDAKTALIYHAKFAKLMRLIFNYSNEKSIPIKEEIEFLKLYIDLEKIRLKYEITTVLELDAIFEEEDLYISPLLIQPIVENSFKHGFLHKEADGNLLIKIQKEAHYIKCTIEDNGVGRAKAKSYNTWQDNAADKKSSSFVTQDRLVMLNRTEGQFPKKITYKISDLKDAQNNPIGTRTELWIPIIN